MSMTPLPRFYNTWTRQIEPFEPMDGHTVRMYTCGPTVHDYAHIGNFRAYVFEDLLRRFLKFHGWGVIQVMNLTDVDDKTIRKSRAAGVSLKEYTQRFIRAFFEDLDQLRIERAEHYPAATDHVPDMIRLIQRLVEKGYAYQSSDGSVYFSIGRFPSYGRLTRLDPAMLRPGARVAQDEYEKDNVADFALWKAWDEADGDVAWDSPWGRGRPGWHIECSAMSMKYLGDTFDIHTGGQDNIFPHHEDEIAQSEAATGRPFVRFWLHCAHLIVDGRKMSKSLGNFYTLRDLLQRGWTGREVRYVLLTTHYRQHLNFTFDSLEAARAALARLDDFRERLEGVAGTVPPASLPAWAANAHRAFHEALADDLNISAAMAALFDVLHEGHRAMDTCSLPAAEAAAVRAMLQNWDRVLGILQPDETGPDLEVLELVRRREQMRAARQWVEADRLRAEILARGWTVQDTPQGPRLRRR